MKSFCLEGHLEKLLSPSPVVLLPRHMVVVAQQKWAGSRQSAYQLASLWLLCAAALGLWDLSRAVLRQKLLSHQGHVSQGQARSRLELQSWHGRVLSSAEGQQGPQGLSSSQAYAMQTPVPLLLGRTQLATLVRSLLLGLLLRNLGMHTALSHSKAWGCGRARVGPLVNTYWGAG